MNKYDENKSVACLMCESARVLKKLFDRRVKKMGITRSQWSVVVQLAKHEGLTQAELAELVEVEQPSLVSLLDKLESAKVIERRQTAEDRRSKRIFLTDKGHEMLVPLQEEALALREEFLTGFTPDEEDMLITLLSRVKGNLIFLSGQEDITSKEKEDV